MSAPAKQQREESWGDLGPAMRALNERQRKFVQHYLLEVSIDPAKAQMRAAIAAGYASDKPSNVNGRQVSKQAYRMLNDPTQSEKVIAAINEESRRLLRLGHPEVIAAMYNIVRDPKHKDHARVLAMFLDRIDPVTTNQNINVVHRHVDPDEEALEELRAARQIGATREKLAELFGGNGLARLERLEAAHMAKARVVGDTIEGEAVHE
jgi:phage terminase small subunit